MDNDESRGQEDGWDVKGHTACRPAPISTIREWIETGKKRKRKKDDIDTYTLHEQVTSKKTA